MKRIDWTCDTCHRPTHGSGAITITYDDIHQADAARRALVDGAHFANLSAEDALAQPKLGLWKVKCDTCAGECIGEYWIDLRKARTAAGLAEWTRHLISKTWFAGTNWDSLVESVGLTRPTLHRVV